MHRVTTAIVLGLLLSGCFETDFSFKTVVHPDGKLDREVQIDGRGANRFLAPSGPKWQVKTSETKGGQSILEDTHYHIHGSGRFQNAKDLTSDFHYDSSKLLSNLTEETRKELIEEVGIRQPLEEHIGTANHVELTRKRTLLSTEYRYREDFQIRGLIPILLHDIKKEIIREQAEAIEPHASPEGAPSEPVSPANLTPLILSPEKVEELAWKNLKEEILPKFQFHSEVTVPGKILDTNASSIRGSTAVWDFRATNFQESFSSYTIWVTSRSLNLRALILSFLTLILAVIALTFSRRRNRGRFSGGN